MEARLSSARLSFTHQRILCKKEIRMFRQYRVLILILAAIVLLALWYAFRPEKLIINKKVDKPPPAVIVI